MASAAGAGRDGCVAGSAVGVVRVSALLPAAVCVMVPAPAWSAASPGHRLGVVLGESAGWWLAGPELVFGLLVALELPEGDGLAAGDVPEVDLGRGPVTPVPLGGDGSQRNDVVIGR